MLRLGLAARGDRVRLGEQPFDQTVFEPGMTVSVQPAIYLPGLYGARIEDVVVCTDIGARRLNQSTRQLTVTDR